MKSRCRGTTGVSHCLYYDVACCVVALPIRCTSISKLNLPHLRPRCGWSLTFLWLSSEGIYSSKFFKREIAPKDVFTRVQLFTKTTRAWLKPRTLLRAMPIVAPLDWPGICTAKATTATLTVATRSRTCLSRIWRRNRR